MTTKLNELEEQLQRIKNQKDGPNLLSGYIEDDQTNILYTLLFDKEENKKQLMETRKCLSLLNKATLSHRRLDNFRPSIRIH